MSTADLEAEAVVKRFGAHTAVDAISFSVERGTFFSILGPSGCGKTTLLRMIAGFVAPDGGDIAIGGRSMRGIAPNRRPVNMVFQQLALFPMMSVGDNVAFGLARRGVARADRQRRSEAMLERVGLGGAGHKRVDELSGGQRQRVAIARALAPDPAVMLADEPVSMLDVSIRLEILNLLDALKRDRNLALLYITHDLATARHFSGRIMVMYRGEIVEYGPADEVILNPSHPYTQLLESAVPRAAVTRDQLVLQRRERLAERKIAPPAERRELAADTGCRFRARCPFAMEICTTHPPDFEVSGGHMARCWLRDPAVAAGQTA